ncbi:MAG: hypothetical protein HY210_07415 [Candidatus Omnitrophica bacterium]|nr:hypothetical protein [Candidatus Omnitrophota bacterium]
MKKLNNKGAVLILAYIVLFVLLTLSAGIASFNINEHNYARRHYFSTAAFWLAEAGINIFMKDTRVLDQTGSYTMRDDNSMIHVTKDDSNFRHRTVTATGTFAGIEKSIQITYPAKAPEVFRNTVSANGDLVIDGKKAMVAINDKTRLNGKIIDRGEHSRVFIEDKDEGVNAGLVSLTYPDANNNGIADEFADFVQVNRDILQNYPPEEVLYIKGNGTYLLAPNSSLDGKKIIYVEGDEGNGNVIILFGEGLKKDQKMTIISTGTVVHNQTGFAAPDSQLNIISWAGYLETAALPSSHNGVIYTHGIAHFDGIYDTTVTNGSVIANGGIAIGEIWSTKAFNYADTTIDEIVPAGFEGLIGGGTSGYVAKPDAWKAI